MCIAHYCVSDNEHCWLHTRCSTFLVPRSPPQRRSRCSSTQIREYQLTPALFRPEIFLNEIVSRSLIQRHEHPLNICCVLPNTKIVLLSKHSSLVWVVPNTFINFWIPAHFPVFQAQAELARMCPDLLTGWAWTTSTSSKFSALEVTLNLSIVFCYIITALVNHIWSILFIHTKYCNIYLQRMGKSSLWGRSVGPTVATSMPWRFVHASLWLSWLSS